MSRVGAGPLQGRRVAMVVTNAYNPDPRVAKEAAALRAAGASVTVFAWDRSGARPRSETVDGVSVRRFAIVCQEGLGLRQIPNFFRFWFAAARAVSREHFDVLHAHDLDGLIPIALSRRHQAKILYDAHELFPLMVGERAGRLAERAAWLLERALIHRADLVVTDGHPRALAYRVALGVREPVLVENTVDERTLAATAGSRAKVRAELGIPDGAWVLGIFTGLNSIGRFDGLWETLDRLPDTWVVVAGRGREAARMEDLARTHERVRFLGYVTELGPLYAAVDAIFYLLVPDSRNSLLGFPNNVATAAVAGVPIITTDDGYAGLLVRRHHLGPLLTAPRAAEIASAIAELRDPARYAYYRRRIGEVRDRFTWTESSRRLLEAYARHLR